MRAQRLTRFQWKLLVAVLTVFLVILLEFIAVMVVEHEGLLNVIVIR